MSEREDHLDLIADEVIEKIKTLLGEAIHEAMTVLEVMRICKIGYTNERSASKYAESLLEDVPSHIASRWHQFRETQKRLCSASVAYDSEGDFD